MIDIAAAVKHDFFDALLEGTLGDHGADLLRGLDVAAVAFKALLHAGRGGEGVAGDVVDDLGIDVVLAAEYAQAGSLGGTGDLAAYSLMALDALASGIGLLIIQAHLRLLGAGLAFFAADRLVVVLDALALVRLGRSLTTDFGCKLADLLLVDTLDDDVVCVGDVDLDVLVLAHDDLVGVTEVHDKVLAFLAGAVADAVDLQLLFKAVGHADDHVVDQRTGQTVQGTVLLGVVGAGDVDDTIVDVDLHLGYEGALDAALGALDGDVIVLVDLDFNAGGNGDGCSTDSRHCVPSLPYKRQDFAADMLLASLLVGHDALGGGDDGNAETLEHAGELVGTGVNAETGLAHAAQALDGACSRGAGPGWPSLCRGDT